MSAQSDDLLLMVGRIDSNVTTLIKAAEDYKGRIEALERDKWRITGAITILAGLFSWFNHDRLLMVASLFGSH